MAEAIRILMVDDDVGLTALVAEYLESEGGFAFAARHDGQSGVEAATSQHFDVIILDVMMPKLNGFNALKAIREACNTPIIMLTARGDDLDRILGLEIGADDYLPKPFEPRELLARVKALLRRAAPEPAADDVMRFGRLEIDLGARQASVDGKPCELTGHQFDLLVVLARSAGRVLTRDQIMDALKGHPLEAFDRSIDVHVSRIRAAIEDDPKQPRRVLTVRGAGYVFARRQDQDDAD